MSNSCFYDNRAVSFFCGFLTINFSIFRVSFSWRHWFGCLFVFCSYRSSLDFLFYWVGVSLSWSYLCLVIKVVMCSSTWEVDFRIYLLHQFPIIVNYLFFSFVCQYSPFFFQPFPFWGVWPKDFLNQTIPLHKENSIYTIRGPVCLLCCSWKLCVLLSAWDQRGHSSGSKCTFIKDSMCLVYHPQTECTLIETTNHCLLWAWV